jgi:hypothetical protein
MKIKFFILCTILFIFVFCLNTDLPNPILHNTILVLSYIGLILVGLYDLGKDEI